MKCPKCGGSGHIESPRTVGAKWRRSREERGLSLREVARRMKFSATYISELELGRKPWSAELEFQFLAALKA